jgi:hypothetical protein
MDIFIVVRVEERRSIFETHSENDEITLWKEAVKQKIILQIYFFKS